MSRNDDQLYDEVCAYAKETALIRSSASVLAWDERTMMPGSAAETRGEQLRVMSGLIHRRWIDSTWGEMLDELANGPLGNLDSCAIDEASPEAVDLRDRAVNVQLLKRYRDRLVKIPSALVEEITSLSVISRKVWAKARAENDYDSFKPTLDRLLQLKREEADAVGFATCRYDALLDEYEPYQTTASLIEVFSELRDGLAALVRDVAESGVQIDLSFLNRAYPVESQRKIGQYLVETIGFDLLAGRIDETVHPFCIGLGKGDCRITTRFHDQPTSSLFALLHEAGHGMYEQGLPDAHRLTPLGDSASLGVHESQSRFWENVVGRSFSFWKVHYEKLQETFPAALSDVTLEAWHRAINDVRPSLIRVEADEATYNLHILIRFELERELIDEQLTVDDLPGAWNDRYEQYLGIRPDSDTNGVLQDVHWPSAVFGYFPTYTLGNIYAAQLRHAIESHVGGLDSLLEQGDLKPIRQWLRENIHQQGSRYRATELMERATGQALSADPLLKYLREKFHAIYGI